MMLLSTFKSLGIFQKIVISVKTLLLKKMSVKPHLDPQRCKRWIELTGRDVGIEKIKSYSYICQVST